MRVKILFLMLLGIFLLNTSGLCADEDWKTRKSHHFIVYYQNTPRDFLDMVIETSEDYYDQITRDLGFRRHKGWSFDDRAKIYIYDDQDHYLESARQSKWSAGVAYYHKRMIKTYPSEAGFFDSLLPHELGHIIFHEFIGTRVSIPSWFSEGVAMHQEKAKRWGSHAKVKKAIEDGTFIPLQELHSNRPGKNSSREEVELFYAEAASVVYFLIKEKGEFRFSSFCRHLQGGDKFLHSLEKAYPRFKNLEYFNKVWVSYLEKQ